MPRASNWILSTACALGCAVTATPAFCDDSDALSLQPEAAPAAGGASPLRAAVELAWGRIDDRLTARTEDGHRASLDLRYASRIGDAWRVGFSDRIDDTHPSLPGQTTTSNSLREAYAGWQNAASSTTVDLGRINLRQGPAYGYNPTDFFRDGALRSITTADPVALRETRMGTGMLRLQQFWTGGGATLALAPKLDSTPDPRPSAIDLGATNASDRALLSVNARASDRFSGQGSILLTRGQSALIGLNATALAGNTLVAYGEWSYGKRPRLFDQLLGTPAAPSATSQAALGLTYTPTGTLALTVEAEYNGAGLDRNGMLTLLAQGPAGYGRYLALTQPSQELGSRSAWLVYLSQKSLGLKQLDLTAFVRTSAVDHSNFAWAELRYHWQRFDAALQWQRSFGGSATEYGNQPYRQVAQLVGVFYY
ncbi:MAG: hypothetical protein KGN16_01610 [Burkholderiales bacterium]|nr:hypothetical protein [Burkholderiales bacterium]